MKSAFSGPSEGGGEPGGNRFVNLLEGRYRRHVSGGAAILEKRGAGVSAQQTSTTINRKKGCRMGSHPGNLAYFRPPATCHTASLSLHLADDGLLLDNLNLIPICV